MFYVEKPGNRDVILWNTDNALASIDNLSFHQRAGL